METDKYIFLTALRDRWVEGGLSANAPDLPITIKIGRNIVFRGEVGAEPSVDKLTKSHMAIIDAAMSLSDQRSTKPVITPAAYESLAGKTIKDVYAVEDDRCTVLLDAAIQAYEALHGKDSFEYPDHSHKPAHDFLKEVGLEPSAAVKGTINIEMGGESLFRYSRGQVDLDVFKPAVPQADLETAAMAAFGVAPEDLAAVVESVAPAVLIHQGESLTVESIVATALETHDPEDITPVIQDAALDAFGFDSVDDVVDEVAFNEPISEPVTESPVTESLYSEPTTPVWMRDDAAARVEQLRQTAQPEPTRPEPMNASEPVAASGVQAAKRLQDGVVQVVEEATTKVPAMAIALMELHDQLKEPARDWLRDRLQEVAESGLGEDLKTKGAAAVREGLKALQQLPRQTRERALADSVMTLVKEFGTVQGDGNGKVETVYQTEGFTIRLQAQDDKALRLQDMSKLNTYVMEDRTGKALLAFQQNGIRGFEITTNQLPLNQQHDLIRAGSQVVADKTVAVAKSASERLQSMVQGLANLAPEGTRAKLRECQHQQVAAIAHMLTNSPAAVDSPAGKTFRGQRYQFFESLGVTRIFGREGQGEVFRKDQSGTQSKLTDRALEDLTSSGKAVVQTQTKDKAKAGKAATGR